MTAGRDRARIIGGPFDGFETAPRSLPFVWVARAGRGVRVYDKPGVGRVLYRTDDGGWLLEYAGNTHKLCSGCGVVQPNEEASRCRLCGAVLIQP